MPNQMPAGLVTTNFRNLIFGFLDSILSKVGHARGDCFANNFCRMSLAYSYQNKIIRRTSRAPRTFINLLAHGIQTPTQITGLVWLFNHDGSGRYFRSSTCRCANPDANQLSGPSATTLCHLSASVLLPELRLSLSGLLKRVLFVPQYATVLR